MARMAPHGEDGRRAARVVVGAVEDPIGEILVGAHADVVVVGREDHDLVLELGVGAGDAADDVAVTHGIGERR
jgi:hypothetical protein